MTAAVSGCPSHLHPSFLIFFPMDFPRLTAVMVLILIAAASIASGHSELTLEQLCTTYATESACRRL